MELSPSYKLAVSSFLPNRGDMVNYTVYVCKRKTTLNANSNTLEPDRLQHVRLAACVIAQQKSFAKFSSLQFYSHKDKLGARFKVVTFSTFFNLLKIP
jgi:hypothetical protein